MHVKFSSIILPSNRATVEVRLMLLLQGTVCRDMMCVWCCEFCVATQMMRELKWYGRWR